MAKLDLHPLTGCVSVIPTGDFPGGSSGKEPACQHRRYESRRFNPWVGRSPREGDGNPLQYSCLENPIDRGTWWATVHGVPESDITERLSLINHALKGRADTGK